MGKKQRTPEEEEQLLEARRLQFEKVRGLAHTPEAKEKAKETRRRNKEMQKEAQFILNAELYSDEEIYDELEKIGYGANGEGGKPTYQTAMLFGIMKKAVYNQDVEAARFIRDTSGQKPIDGMAIGTLEDKPLDINLSSYTDEELREMVAKRKAMLDT